MYIVNLILYIMVLKIKKSGIFNIFVRYMFMYLCILIDICIWLQTTICLSTAIHSTAGMNIHVLNRVTAAKSVFYSVMFLFHGTSKCNVLC